MVCIVGIRQVWTQQEKQSDSRQDKRKLTTGKALIRYFCVPCKPTKSNGNRTWNLPKHAPEKWALFKDYCKQDVVTEHEILKRLEQYPVPEAEELLWQMDIRMNAFGVRVDEELIDGALAIDELCTEELTNDAVRITDLQNPNSPAQLKAWIETKISGEISGLTKENVAELLARNDISDEVRKVLEIRQQLGKTSIKKYVAMKTAKGEGDRVRGLTQFYGANRTGRWAGRLVQMQNLPRNYLKTLDEARHLVKAKNYEGVRLFMAMYRIPSLS